MPRQIRVEVLIVMGGLSVTPITCIGPEYGILSRLSLQESLSVSLDRLIVLHHVGRWATILSLFLCRARVSATLRRHLPMVLAIGQDIVFLATRAIFENLNSWLTHGFKYTLAVRATTERELVVM